MREYIVVVHLRAELSKLWPHFACNPARNLEYFDSEFIFVLNVRIKAFRNYKQDE
jgi:hypothetical protein